ncbi:MAG: apolipoprotein N-acyltransferase [bacterium]
MSLFTGLLVIAAFPNDIAHFPELPWAIWIAFVPMLGAAAMSRTAKEAFLCGYLSGVVGHAGVLYWLISFGPIPVISLSLMYSVVFGMTALCAWLAFRRASPASWWWMIPVCAVALTVIEALGTWGFPWLLPAYALSYEPLFIQLADIGGVSLVGFSVYLVNVAIYQALFHPGDSRLRIRAGVICAAAFALILGYGYFSLSRSFEGQKLSVALVQGGLESDVEWTSNYSARARETYVRATDLGIGSARPDLVVWPESTTGELTDPAVNLSIAPLIRSVATRHGACLLFGSITKRNGAYYNSAVLLNERGRIEAVRDKIAVVPFGEALPFRRAIQILPYPWGEQDIDAGRSLEPLSFPLSRRRAGEARYAKIATGVCFDSIFPYIPREQVRRGGQAIAVITNNSWYKLPSGTVQHSMMDAFRAVENRRFLLRCATTGISQVIDPAGIVIKETRPLSPGFISESIALLEGQTVYTRLGEWFGWLCVAIALVAFTWLCCVGEMEGFL